MKEKRLKFIDIARAFAIIFIVLGHTIVYSEHCKFIYKILYSFNVVLFFVLSGYTFKVKKDRNFYSFFKNKFFRIMIPYFFWAIVFILPYMVFGENMGKMIGNESSFDWIVQIKNVFYGNGNNFALKQNSSLWFLPALFTMEIIYYFIIKHDKNNKCFDIILLIFELLVGYITYYFLHIYFPWGLNTTLQLGVFFHIGYLYKKYKLIEGKSKLLNLPNITFIFVLGILSSYFNTRNVSAIDYQYGYMTLALISGICLSTLVIYLAYKVNNNRILEYIGKNTMGILIFHKIIILVFQTKIKIVSDILKSSNIIIELVTSIIISILAIIFSLILTKITRSLMPVLIGEKM